MISENDAAAFYAWMAKNGAQMPNAFDVAASAPELAKLLPAHWGRTELAESGRCWLASENAAKWPRPLDLLRTRELVLQGMRMTGSEAWDVVMAALGPIGADRCRDEKPTLCRHPGDNARVYRCVQAIGGWGRLRAMNMGPEELGYRKIFQEAWSDDGKRQRDEQMRQAPAIAAMIARAAERMTMPQDVNGPRLLGDRSSLDGLDDVEEMEAEMVTNEGSSDGNR